MSVPVGHRFIPVAQTVPTGVIMIFGGPISNTEKTVVAPSARCLIAINIEEAADERQCKIKVMYRASSQSGHVEAGQIGLWCPFDSTTFACRSKGYLRRDEVQEEEKEEVNEVK